MIEESKELGEEGKDARIELTVFLEIDWGEFNEVGKR